jgi:SEC-C motif domain protein
MRSKTQAQARPCPCDSGESYAQCCGVFHQAFGVDASCNAPTPEALMRSRYSAYTLGLADYLLATWHPATSPGELNMAPVKWLGLEVLHADAVGDAGVVSFVARFKDYGHSGRAERLQETSRFVRVDGRWLYIDGEPEPNPVISTDTTN